MLSPVERSITPFAAPDRFLDLFTDARREGGVSDVRVDLHQETFTNDHRLGFRVIDVCRNDGSSGGDLLADEVGGDIGFHAHGLDLLVLADGNIFHFGRDDPFLGIIHLGDVLARFCPVGQVPLRESDRVELGVFQALPTIPRGQAVELDEVFPPGIPLLAQAGQSLVDVDWDLGIRVRTAGVVDDHRIVLLEHFFSILVECHRVEKLNLSHANLDLVDLAFDVDLLGRRVAYSHIVLVTHIL